MAGTVQLTLSMSLDGYITGPDPSYEVPLGAGGAERLRPGGRPELAGTILAGTGATVVGRNMYDHVRGWGEDPPFKMPVFVITHRPHPVRVAGATTFNFVDAVATAFDLAKRAAREKDVYIGGGADIADQALRLGLVDEVNVFVEPTLLGGGTRLFDHLGGDPIDLERIGVAEYDPNTHLRFRVLR
ncbi:MAG: dihydrofolate reductase family protein [Streptosporangiales bacterium]|nr:dihydrofolate reductase family protein [Streptosporangiales bacterium]MBO0891087.1 dihydrofolate reductase family protein [Acidothermales bacterium]